AGKAILVPGSTAGAWVWATAGPAARRAASRVATSLDIEVRYLQRIVLDEVAARLDHVAHQGGEDLVGLVGVVYLDLQQGARLRIERGFPKLVGIHLAQPLVALDCDAFAARFQHCGEERGRRRDRRFL